MIGNSVRSDVLPVLEVGGQAALVPYHLTWELERAEPPQSHDGYWELDDISQVPALVAGLGRTRAATEGRDEPVRGSRTSRPPAIADRTGVARHDVAVVLGSGWGDAAAELGTVVWEGPLTDVPGVPRPTVGGHKGRLVSVDADGRAVLVFAGRSHLYEGHGAHTVVHARARRGARRLLGRRAHERGRRARSRRRRSAHRSCSATTSTSPARRRWPATIRPSGSARASAT